MDATEEIQKICEQVKPEVEKKTGKNYREYNAVKYRKLEADENYLIQVHVGEIGKEDYIHLSVHVLVLLVRGMPSPNFFLKGVQQHKTKEDPLIPFALK